MEKYQVQNQEIGPIPVSDHGFNEEIVIINYSGEPIGIIDKFNNKKIINPEKIRNNTIKIFIKRDMGSRVVELHKIKISPGIICTIKHSDILTDSLYIKEADIVLCHYKNLDVFNHPNISLSYEEAIHKLFEELSKVEEIRIPTLKIMANSNDTSINKLYVSIFGMITETEITHYLTSDNGVSFIFPSDKMKTIYISFDEIKKSKGHIKNNLFNCFISTSKEEIKKAIEEDQNIELKYSEEDILKIKETLKKEYDNLLKETKETIKTQYENELRNKNNRISQLENELASAKIEIDTLRRLISSADSFLNYTQKSMNHHTENMKNETEKFKIFVAFAKIAIPVVLAWSIGKYT